jgi:uncharacterized repeat protein (TIGR04138 family)
MSLNARLFQVARSFPRYPYEAYEFVFAGLNYTQQSLGRIPKELEHAEHAEPAPQYHVTGRELLEGIRELALREFGMMARVVFRMWGVENTVDFGRMVFNLVEAGLMSKTDEDSLADFENVYDLDRALVQGFRIQLDEAEWTR